MRRYALIPLFSLLLLSARTAAPQAGSASEPQFTPHRHQDDLELRRERERQKRLNKDRVERIKKDTDRLFALATELKDYVDKTNENVMSLQVINKAEEIEKLAHSVKDKMKEDYTPPAQVQ